MFQKYIIVVMTITAFQISCINAYSEQSKLSMGQQLNPVSRLCIRTTGVTQLQVDSARINKNFHLLSACFFNCFLKKLELIKYVAGNEGLDIPAILVFAKKYIPTINLLNVLQVSAAVIKCDIDFQKALGSDFEVGCPKSRVLTDCLAASPILTELIIRAIQSDD